ncbi:hypothetical protein [Candidatus Nitrotoga sp. M5]|uniref:hypothetical protein n=1 Tax=Candidatus Nitrotoga sp. M5 TaxID=2890409 RepID=UPI001EF4BAB2|nr:hypothetical protein [Candidatus Nitrotoga sp. M5]CAH1387218.1 conserved exported hypothetical protein [Candidatus Nitrotoga sp. M5]
MFHLNCFYMIRCIFAAVLLSTTSAWASDLSIYVAPKGSTAYAAAKSLGNGQVERRLHKAFAAASSHLTQCINCTVTINVAGGEYTGKANVGLWVFPDTVAPKGMLRILGGWNEDFSQREPFQSPSLLKSTDKRSSVVLAFAGRKPTFKQLVVSGLTFDTSPSNRYDKNTNSFMKGGSSTFGQISFGYVSTDSLIISDNTFMNASSGGVGGPVVKPLGNNGEVRIQNNVFFNNIVPWAVASGSYSNPPARYIIKGNSFVLSWPYNADVATSNPGAIEIGNSRAAGQVEIEQNLFAYNFGGAVFSQWDDTKSPKLVIKNNLFYANGGLFGARARDSGAVVGKFAGAATHSIYSMDDIEDDFSWSVSGNQSFDPEIEIGVPDTIGLSSYGERDEGAEPVDQESDDASVSDDELANDLSELTALLAGSDAEAKSDNTDLESDSDGGLDLNLNFEDFADQKGTALGTIDLKNYAPKLSFEPGNLPFSRNPKARQYGASPERVSRY